MTDIFLTPNLKKYYMDDFTKNVLPCKDDFWGINIDIKDILIKINENSNVQSIYSHKMTFMKASYIDFAFAQDIELTIFREIIPYLQACYNTNSESKFNFYYSYPKSSNEVKEKNDNNELSACVDKNYWKINNIRFELTTTSREIDDKFWQDIQTKLSGLK